MDEPVSISEDFRYAEREIPNFDYVEVREPKAVGERVTILFRRRMAGSDTTLSLASNIHDVLTLCQSILVERVFEVQPIDHVIGNAVIQYGLRAWRDNSHELRIPPRPPSSPTAAAAFAPPRTPTLHPSVRKPRSGRT